MMTDESIKRFFQRAVFRSGQIARVVVKSEMPAQAAMPPKRDTIYPQWIPAVMRHNDDEIIWIGM